jgi:hypothetical protein
MLETFYLGATNFVFVWSIARGPPFNYNHFFEAWDICTWRHPSQSHNPSITILRLCLFLDDSHSKYFLCHSVTGSSRHNRTRDLFTAGGITCISFATHHFASLIEISRHPHGVVFLHRHFDWTFLTCHAAGHLLTVSLSWNKEHGYVTHIMQLCKIISAQEWVRLLYCNVSVWNNTVASSCALSTVWAYVPPSVCLSVRNALTLKRTGRVYMKCDIKKFF